MYDTEHRKALIFNLDLDIYSVSIYNCLLNRKLSMFLFIDTMTELQHDRKHHKISYKILIVLFIFIEIFYLILFILIESASRRVELIHRFLLHFGYMEIDVSSVARLQRSRIISSVL